jgi:hypothetical protein
VLPAIVEFSRDTGPVPVKVPDVIPPPGPVPTLPLTVVPFSPRPAAALAVRARSR